MNAVILYRIEVWLDSEGWDNWKRKENEKVRNLLSCGERRTAALLGRHPSTGGFQVRRFSSAAIGIRK